MHIYFQDFKSSKQVVWSHTEGSNIAQCVYRITGEKNLVEPSLINPLLARIPGIEIIDGIAIIKDLETFRHNHPFSIAPDEPKLLRFSSVKQLMFYRENDQQDLQQTSSSSSSSYASTSTCSSSSNYQPPPISPRTRIVAPLTFKTMLADFSGETLVYDADAELNLRANNDSNLIRLSSLGVHSYTSVNLTLQVIKNIDYYILRQLQIKEAKKLFEQDIIPAIHQFQNGAPLPKYVIEYFAYSVRNIMRNSRYNSMDTAFEANFNEDKEPIPIKSNYDLRGIYAKEMLRSLLSLVTDMSFPSNIQPELQTWLIKFKEHLNINAQKARQLERLYEDRIHEEKALEELGLLYKEMVEAQKARELELIHRNNPDAEIAQKLHIELEVRYQINLETDKAIELECLCNDNLDTEKALEQAQRYKDHLEAKKAQVLEYLYKDTENRSHMLLTLEHLILCTGLMDHDYKKLQLDSIVQNGHLDFSLLMIEIIKLHQGDTTLHYALQQLEPEHQLPTKSETILPPVLYPLRTIIYNWFQMGLHHDTKVKLREQGILELVNDTMKSVMPIFLNCTKGDIKSASAKHISHTIKLHDPDLYVNPEWKASLEFKFIENTRVLAAHKKYSMKPEKWKKEIIAAVNSVVEGHKHMNMERAQVSSQSSSAPTSFGM